MSEEGLFSSFVLTCCYGGSTIDFKLADFENA